MQEKKTQKKDTGPIKITKGGNLTFKQSTNSQGRFDIASNITIPASHIDRNIIVVESKPQSQIQIFQIREEGIILASKHRIHKQIDGPFDRIINNSTITYLFPKQLVEKTKKSLKFFEEKGIDWETTSQLIFSFEYGLDGPDVIEPVYLGELNDEHSGYRDIDLEDIFDRQKPLLGSTHCLISRKSKGLFAKGIENLIAEFGPKMPNLARAVFKFKTDYQKTQVFKDKIEVDQSKVDEHHLKYLLFDEERFFMENAEGDQNLKFKPFFQMSSKMAVLGLYDFRLKKVTAKSFISVYELFEGLESMKITKSLRMSVMNGEYSPNLDIMAMEISLERAIPISLEPKLIPLQELELKAGRKNPFELSLMIKNIGVDSYVQIKNLRFLVHNCFYRTGSKRRVEIVTEGYRTNSHIRLSRGAMISHEESDGLFSFRIRQRRTHEAPKRSRKEADAEQDFKEPLKTVSEGDQNLLDEQFKLPFSVLKGVLGEDDYNIKAVALIHETVLLIVCHSKMFLIEFRPKSVFFCTSFTNGVNLNISAMKHSHELIATSNIALGVVNFHQLRPNTEGGLDLTHIARCNLRMIQSIHSVRRLLHFDKIDEKTYQMRLEVDYMLSKMNTVTSPYIFSAKVEVERSDDGTLKVINYLDMEIDKMYQGTNYDHVSSYMKGKDWYQIYTFEEENYSISINKLDECDGVCQRAMFCPDDPEGGESRRILDCHAGKEYNYYVLGGYLNRPFAADPGVEVQAINFKDKNLELGFMINPQIMKSLKFGRNSVVRFDEVSDEVRIFKYEVTEMAKDIRLEVYNSELEKISEFEIEGIDEIYNFYVVDKHRLSLEGVYTESNADKIIKKDVSLLVDLRNRKSSEMVDQDGEKLTGVPDAVLDLKLIAFTRSKRGCDYQHFEGIFVSEEPVIRKKPT